MTECSLPVKWAGSPSLEGPTEAELKSNPSGWRKPSPVLCTNAPPPRFTFSCRTTRKANQFGIVHADLTPRPAFVALAAVGRLLAQAEPLGKLNDPDKTVQAYLFRAAPDGDPCEVLVAWTDDEPGEC